MASSNPELFGWVWRFKGELVLCGLLVVEGYFVTHHSMYTHGHTDTCSIMQYCCLMVSLRWVFC